MVNFVYSITHTLYDVVETPDKTGFWMDYNMTDIITSETILRYTPNGEYYPLLTVLQFFYPFIRTIQPFRIDNLSELVSNANPEPGDTLQVFVCLDNELIRTETPLFSIIISVK